MFDTMKQPALWILAVMTLCAQNASDIKIDSPEARVLVLSGVGTAGFMFGNGMIKDVQFARAEDQVQASREQIMRLRDLLDGTLTQG